MQVLARVTKLFSTKTSAVKVFPSDKPTAFATVEDSQLNAVQLSFEDPAVMREIGNALLSEADNLEKEINA